jgi:hypothetical protein
MKRFWFAALAALATSATEIIALDCSDVDGCTNGGGCREITRGPRQVVR